jgi:multiple sugar transport system substrate-binding protein
VTQKARDDASYQAYLNYDGPEDAAHYSVKLKASKLLIEHTSDTFVTPVFNGSTSLRDASGQLIENTVKSVRRGETVDDAYFAKLYDSVTALYRLGQGNTAATGKADLGPLPGTAKALLGGLLGVWVLIGVYVLFDRVKRRNR